MTQDASFSYVNEQACRSLGYTREELLQLKLWDVDPVYPTTSWAAIWEQWRVSRSGGSDHLETLHRRKDGTIFPVEISTQHIWFDEQELHVAVAKDITERKQMEAALRESEKRYRTIVETAQEGIWLIDNQGITTYANPKMAEMLGITADEIHGRSMYDFMDDAGRREAQHNLQRRSQGIREKHEFRLKDKTGNDVWTLMATNPIMDDQGTFVAALAMVTNVTERKQMQQSLEANEERFRLSVRVGQIGIFDHDHLSNTVYWSPEHRAIYGWGLDEPVPLGAGREHVHPEDLERVDKAVRLAWDPAGDGAFDVEYRIIDRQGAVHWLSIRSRTWFEGEDASRHPVRTIGAVSDITELKQMQEALRLSEERYRMISQLFSDYAYSYKVNPDLSYELEWVTEDALARITGIQRHEFGNTIDNYHPDDLLRRQHDVQEMLTGKAHEKDYRIYNKWGEMKWVHIGRYPIWDETQRRVVRFYGVVKDITESKLAEARLFESEQMLQNVLDNIPIRVFWKDVNSRILGCNQPFAEDLGYSTDTQLIGRTNLELMQNPTAVMRKQVEQYEQDDRQVIASGVPRIGYEEPQWRADGQLYWLRTSKVPLHNAEGRIIGVLGTYEDITERKRMLEMMRESEERLQQAVRVGNIGIFDHDHRTNAVYWSAEECRIWDLEPGTPASLTFAYERMYPDDRERVLKQAALATSPGGDGLFDVEHRILDSKGAVRWISLRAQTLFEGDGQQRRALRTIGATIDITERKHTEESLKRYNQRVSILREIDHRILLADSPDKLADTILEQLIQLIPCDWASIVIFNDEITEERIIALKHVANTNVNVDDSYKVIPDMSLGQLKLGRSIIVDDITGTKPPYANIAKIWLAEGMHAAMGIPLVVQGRLAGVLALAAVGIGFFTSEYLQIAEEIGTQIAIALHQSSLKREITRYNEELERRVDERTAELAEANEEIKNFAYIVSHDLRAPLVNLKGFSGELRAAVKQVSEECDQLVEHINPARREALLRSLKEDIPEALQFIESSVSSMDGFTKAILKLSRLGRLHLELVKVDTRLIVEKILAALNYQMNQRSVKLIIGDLPLVMADYVSIEQIFGNILSNAVAYLTSERPGTIEISAEQNDNQTLFSIRDNGRGIAPEDMDKVFAPFRRAGRQDVPGEGMGLAYVQTLVRRHGGRIWCESQLGVGTTFKFLIPHNPTVEINSR
ncbi:MAG: PAS domain S-box protein [Anaerolineae bacterium]